MPAQRGLPTCGKLPFGRVYDKKTGALTVDPEKLAIIQNVAQRYLRGEPLPKLAREYGMNHSNLHKILTKRCGSTWAIRFRAKDLSVDETVELTVPSLLPEKTIRAVRQRVEANKTYQHGNPKHRYLFSGFIFCGQCGYNMFGQMNHDKRRYYRHAHTSRARACSLDPRPWVRADVVETVVSERLAELFGNPAAMRRAVEQAIPNRAKIATAEQRVKCLEADCVSYRKPVPQS